ncbi:chorismate-binding protein [Deinococcus sonorensis]|uniref:Chorismate-binding protein n=2 Tax=Deinococcus sonorensis TaxID=309891 RepID=A0AAU7UF54_9DEIO
MLPRLSPRQVLLRLRAAGVPGIVLLESLGPVTPTSRYTLLSAAPVQLIHDLPPRPDGEAFFPAWLGGLQYEAAAGWGLPTHPPTGPAQHWGWHPSGLIWDRQTDSLTLMGEAHLDWVALLGGPEAPDPELTVGAFSPDDLDYPAGVAAVQQLILAGEVYQVNLSRGVRASAQGDPLAAYLRLRDNNPSPYMAYAELGDGVVVSCSPEQLTRWEGHRVTARPIAGTHPRGETPPQDERLERELRASPKEQAEHLMLVDLIRHDLGWVSAPGTVQVPDLMLVERYSHVMHLVSEVEGVARPDLDVAGLLQATFPGGTITGAPKRRVMQAIRELEPGPRGWYTGSVGVVSGKRAELNILIRTAAFAPAPGGWIVEVRAGGGIVMDSAGGPETQETVHKAQALLNVLAGTQRPGQPPAAPRPGVGWRPPPAPGQHPMRVLLLDNFDSFTQNLAHDLAALGAEVLLRDHTARLDDLLALRPDAVLIGPGPGTPQTSGVTLPLTRRCLDLGLPLLGVCLGHQALGEALGGTVTRAPAAIHGKPERVRHAGTGLFEGVAPDAEFTRYHSLIVERLPAPARVTATSATGEIMALEAAHAPAWGVQFHPESVLSRPGRQLLHNWLTLARAAVAAR